MGTLRRVRGADRGAAAVEAALVLTVVVLPLIFGVISYAYMFSFRQALSQAAAEGARAAVGSTSTSTCSSSDPTTYTASTCAAQYAAVQAIQSALSQYNMTCVSSSTTITDTRHLGCNVAAPSACSYDATHNCLTVVVTYPYRSETLLPTVPGLGFTLPSQLGFTSVVQVS